MIVKPMFKQPAEVRLSKSEQTILAKAALLMGQLEALRPDLRLEGWVEQITAAVDKLAAESKARAKPEGEK